MRNVILIFLDTEYISNGKRTGHEPLTEIGFSMLDLNVVADVPPEKNFQAWYPSMMTHNIVLQRGVSPFPLVETHKANSSRDMANMFDGIVLDFCRRSFPPPPPSSSPLISGDLRPPLPANIHQPSRPSASPLISGDLRPPPPANIHQPARPSASPLISGAPSSPTPSLSEVVNIERYLQVLWKMCGDNMKGQKCHTPTRCMDDGVTFRCLDYPNCNLSFCHKMTIHTAQACRVRSNQPCQRIGCAKEVDVYHVVATCKGLWNGKLFCDKDDCRWGHDFVEVRSAIMRHRRDIAATNKMTKC